MAGKISLADFNRIATGTYNAGQIDFATGKDGATELVKVNNHVWQTSKNRVQLAPERVLEIKESFVAGEGTAVLHDFEPPRKGVVVSFR